MHENREIVTIEEQTYLIKWVGENNKIFLFNRFGSGKFCHIDEMKAVDSKAHQIITDIRNRIVARENLSRYEPCRQLPDLIYIMEPGTKLHTHDDSAYKNNKGIHIRFNVCIQKPDIGGRPIYAGNTIELIEREYIICRAELDYHSSEWISGSKPKINLSFGFIVDSNDIKKFSNREKLVTNTISNNIRQWKLDDSIQLEALFNNRSFYKRYLINNHNTHETDFLHKLVRMLCNENNIKTENLIMEVIFCNSLDNKFTIECDKLTKQSPVSTMMLFASEIQSPLVFTHIDTEAYKYKEIPSESELYLYKPRLNTCIAFDSSKFYGFYKQSTFEEPNDLRFIKINLWRAQISKELYELPPNSLNFDIVIEEGIQDLQKTIFNSGLIEMLLYERKYITDLENIIKEDEFVQWRGIVKVSNKYRKYIDFNELQTKYGDLAEDLYPLISSQDIQRLNRFSKTKIFLNVLSKDVCYWVINECEKVNKWNKSPYINFETYLNLEILPSILSYFLFVSNYYLMQIKKGFEIENKDVKFNIKDIFITKVSNNFKYNSNKRIESHFIATIQLNDEKDFQGGLFTFQNDSQDPSIALMQGDMLVFNGNQNLSISQITQGERYLIVFLIEITL